MTDKPKIQPMPEPGPRDRGAISGQPSNLNNLQNVSFSFVINRLPGVEYFCQGVALPGINLGVAEQPTPGMVRIPHPGDITFDELTVNFMVDEDMKNFLEIFNWIRQNSNVDDYREHNPDTIRSDATLIINSSNIKPNLEVTFHNLFPIALTGLDFDRTSDQSEALTTNATFTFTSYDIKCI